MNLDSGRLFSNPRAAQRTSRLHRTVVDSNIVSDRRRLVQRPQNPVGMADPLPDRGNYRRKSPPSPEIDFGCTAL